MINKAIEFATKAHEGQFRKGTTRPYILHPLEAMDIVKSMTNDETVISAAVLHDTIEDCEKVTRQLIKEHFGEKVADLVASESEDKNKSWKERKSATIERLKTASKEVQIIALGDKLSNIRDIYRDYLSLGDALWKRFHAPDKQAIGWYYKGIRESLRDTFPDTEAYKEYCRLVTEVFGDDSSSPD